MRGDLRLRLARVNAIAHYGFPFSLGNPVTPTARLRALGFRARFAHFSPAKRWLGRVAMTMTWPAGALFDALRNARALCAEDPRRAFFAILRDMYGLALTHNIPPLEYQLYRLCEPARRREMDQYLYWNDLPALAALNASRGADHHDVQDKHRFAAICTRFDLPHVTTLAAFDRGRQIAPDRPFVPEHGRLFVKNLRGKGGQDAERWTREDGHYRSTENSVVPAGRLAEVLRRVDCIVQPCLENHPALAALSNGALACLRVVTGIDRAGRAEVIWVMLGLPAGASKCTTGGIACRLALETGAITRAFRIQTQHDIVDHPDTGAPLIGFVPPFLRESIELAQHAHAAAFPRFAFLGWDVAITEPGPVLLETNSGWGALFHQMMDGPIGSTAFSRLVEEHLDACG